MKLNSWLRQDHSFPERLQVVERLAQALNEIHDRGESLAALDPERVEVSGDGSCDVSAARRGTPSPAYSAPERSEGAGPSPEADIYAAGAIAWEVLSGRPCGSSPTHLAEASPSVPRELADAVMACLEQSPQWRPRDLTYLAQLAQHAQGQRPKAERAARAPAAGRSGARAAAGGANMPLRSTMRRESKSHLPLAMAAGLVVAAAAGSYYWLTRESGATAGQPPTPGATAVTVAARPLASPAPGAGGATSVATPVPVATPSQRPVPTTAPAFAPAATPTPAPARIVSTPVAVAPAPAGTLPPFRPVTTEPVAPRATLPPLPVTTLPVTTTTTTTVPPAPAVREPVVLLTLSPLAARRPGKQIFDLRGTGLRQDLRVRVLAVKDVPRGVTVLRQVWKGPTLFQVLIDLDESVSPGPYALVLEDAAGGLTKSLTFTVTK